MVGVAQRVTGEVAFCSEFIAAVNVGDVVVVLEDTAILAWTC